MSAPVSARRVVTVSLLVDLLDVVSCLAVALITGSAAVFAEMAQGLADVAGSLCLVIGERRARRPRTPQHPLGYQREAFFWALLSALAMLVLGGGLSFVYGYEQLVRPEPLDRPWLALGVLGLAVVTNGYSVWLGLRSLGGGRATLREAVREALRGSGRPLVEVALARDAVGTLSALLGLLAVLACQGAGLVVFDALGALVIAALTSGLALLAIARARALIVGRSIPDASLQSLRRAVQATPGVVALNELTAVYSGSREIVVELDLDLDDALDTAAIEELLDQLQRRTRAAVPEAGRVRVDLNSPETGYRALGAGPVRVPSAAGAAETQGGPPIRGAGRSA